MTTSVPAAVRARYRRERNEARQHVKALEEQLENLLAREVARVACDILEDGWDLILFHPDLSELLDDGGIPDPKKVAERAQQLVGWKPGLAKGARVPSRSFGQGRRPGVYSGSEASWAAVLRGVLTGDIALDTAVPDVFSGCNVKGE